MTQNLSGFDAHEAAGRVALLDTYVQLIGARMGLAPGDALQPAALLVATHGLNNELGGIIASLAQPGCASTSTGTGTGAVSGAATAMICNAIDAAARQTADALCYVGGDVSAGFEALAGKMDALSKAIENAGDSVEWGGRHAKDGAGAISASLDCIARDLRNSTADAIYARVDEALKQQRMVANAQRRVAGARCK